MNSLLKKTRRFLKKNRTFLLVNLTLFFSSFQWNLTSWNFKGPRITSSKCLWTKVDPVLWTTSELLEVLTSFLAFKEYSKPCAVFQVQKSLKSLFWISVTTSNVEHFWLVTNVKRRNQWLFVRSESTKNVSKMISTKILVFLSVLQGKNFI